MKKLILVLTLAVMAVSAHAQVYLGGSFNFSAKKNAQVSILPEVGYAFSDNMAAGLVVGYANDESVTWLEGASAVLIAPYFRYTFINAGPVRLFVDAEFQIGIVNEGNQSAANWNLGIRPGLALPITDHLSFVGHFGRLGYYEKTFSFGVNASTFLAGIYYSF